MFRAAPLQIMSIIQWSFADVARSSTYRIVTLGTGDVPFAASPISFCSRGTLQRNLSTMHSSLVMILEHPRTLQIFQAAECPLQLSVTFHVDELATLV